MKVLVIGHQGMLARELLPCLGSAGLLWRAEDAQR